MLTHISALLACWAALTVAAQNSSAGLRLGPIDFAGYDNYVYRDNVTAVQVVVSDSSSASPARFITAFPEGNTGALVYLVPRDNGSLGVTLNQASLQSTFGTYNQSGIKGSISVSNDFEFGVTLIGSVRTLRDYVESGGTVFHTIFNYTLGDYSNSSVTLVRHWINGSTVQTLSFSSADAVFSVIPHDNVTLPPNITVTRKTSGGGASKRWGNVTSTPANITLDFASSYNFSLTTPATPFVAYEGLGAQAIFASGRVTQAVEVVSAIRNASVANQVAFLGYTEKFLAGGWRFLTYFGRDTLLALRLLLPVISPTSAEAITSAVLERANSSSGELCHEETIGDYASFVNIQNNQSELGNTPSYSYVMLDTDFLLLPVFASYFLSNATGKTAPAAFLNRSSILVNGSYGDLLASNIAHVLNLTAPFAQAPNVSNLVPIRSYPVGDWRDSNTGLGYGVYPFDVECALIPAALRAISDLAAAGVIASNYSVAGTYAAVWEASAPPLFEVAISASVAELRLATYVERANLSTSLLYSAGSLNDSQTVNIDTSAAWGENVIGSGNGTSTFYALSLMPNGTAVEVLHSDLGFALLYSANVSTTLLNAVVQALQPYPRGLLTNVGMVVANAAYDSNATDIDTFSNVMYHGAVSWSWQQGLMAAGLSRQLGLCGLSDSTQLAPVADPRPAWCDDTALTSALQQAQTRLWDAIAGSASVLYTEVWSPIFGNGTFSIGDLGAISPVGTEGDAIQLWSYGFLAQVDPRTGKPVAAGFS